MYTLKEIRTTILHLSMDEMAKELDITKEAWRLKENYKNPLKARELMKIVKLSDGRISPEEIIQADYVI